MVRAFPQGIVRASVAFTLFTMIGAISCGPSYASEQPQPGNKYTIAGPVYLSGIYRNLNNRQLNRQMAFGSLTAVRFSGPWVAFQCQVPIGTIMTIIGSAPKVWHLPFLANRYFVRLDPDLSRGLEVDLELNRGIEGSLDGLNPKIFRKETLTRSKQGVSLWFERSGRLGAACATSFTLSRQPSNQAMQRTADRSSISF